MNFEAALTAMRAGNRATRPAFRSLRGSFSVTIGEGGDDFVKVASSGAYSQWQATTADILATDWQVV